AARYRRPEYPLAKVRPALYLLAIGGDAVSPQMPILSIQAPLHLLPCRSRAWKGAAMDAAIPSVSASHLAERVSAGRFPCLIDVRREEGYAGSGTVIRGARRRPPEQIDIWAQNLARDREI